MREDLKTRGEKQIIHFTIGRSGSAFISQILFHIFGRQNVWAGHEPVNFKAQNDQRVIVTYRDFRDVAVSYWRTSQDISDEALNNGRKLTAPDVRRFANSVRGMVSHDMAVTLKNNPDALLMRYEDFFPDKFDYIFGKIENHCDIVIAQDVKDEIVSEYNIKKNKKRSDAAKSFKKVGEKWMHGKHVYKGKVGGWKDLVPENLHDNMNNILRKELEEWGYKI